jgi:hypothetical protein
MMNNEKLIRKLRAMLSNEGITQDDYSTICQAVRALGGNP